MTDLYSHTYTATRTRTEAVYDQFAMFLMYSGLPGGDHAGILLGVESRWIEALAVYLRVNDCRVLEAEVNIDWSLHSDLCVISPTVRSELPGWADGAAPEIQVIGRRFGLRADAMNVVPSFWVRFVADINHDRLLYRQRCRQVGVDPDSYAPAWRSNPVERSYRVEELGEVGIALREGW